MIPLKDDNPTSSKPIITYCLIIICILVFLIELASPSYRTGEFFYSYGLIPSVLLGKLKLAPSMYVIPAYLTIITSMFVHGGFMHLIGNMLYMWIFADNIEDSLGKVKFLIFYILCGIGAAMAQVFTDTNSQIPMVGASGAIGGVLGAYLVNYPKAKILVTEVFDIPPKNLAKVSSSSILPEFILFHKLSKQQLFFHKQFKHIINNSKYRVIKEIKYSKMKLQSSSSPSYSTFMLSPK